MSVSASQLLGIVKKNVQDKKILFFFSPNAVLMPLIKETRVQREIICVRQATLTTITDHGNNNRIAIIREYSITPSNKGQMSS